jgi:diaminohydroxyphosphoribosylaminopyrimidine deaminase/5-amino-6-(5-phosphoribosylamino)uracil reductase
MDEATYLSRALELARRGLGHTRPNPAVGAVIVKDGVIIGEGWHRKAGTDHAEVAAIKDARRRRRTVAGATIYVTLEPCSKTGRTGACTDAIAAAGIARVVYAVNDPNPTNRGRAKRVLARRGIVCERFTGDRALQEACARLVADFRKRLLTGLPYVIVKIAVSLDGKICDDAGRANWISCAASRRRTSRLRECVDAILVGAETVRKDNPSLLAKVGNNRDLVRVVISKSGRLPPDAQIFTDGRNETLVFDDAKKALVALGARGLQSVLCEGGLTLARALAAEGLVDEWLTVTAPVVIGAQPLPRALRGRAVEETCFLADGDSFFKAALSEFAAWSGGRLSPPALTRGAHGRTQTR